MTRSSNLFCSIWLNASQDITGRKVYLLLTFGWIHGSIPDVWMLISGTKHLWAEPYHLVCSCIWFGLLIDFEFKFQSLNLITSYVIRCHEGGLGTNSKFLVMPHSRAFSRYYPSCFIHHVHVVATWIFRETVRYPYITEERNGAFQGQEPV